MDFEALSVTVPDLRLSSVESLVFSLLNFLILLAEFGPFHHMSAVWLALLQCGEVGYVFAFDHELVFFALSFLFRVNAFPTFFN